MSQEYITVKETQVCSTNPWQRAARRWRFYRRAILVGALGGLVGGVVFQLIARLIFR